MRVWQWDAAAKRLREEQRQKPGTGPGEMLIQVMAAGVTPTELQWYPTTHLKDGNPRMNAVPGHEFSGRVVTTLPGMTELSEGEEIFGMNDWFAEGATADFCVTKPEWIFRKPRNLTHAEAASVPIGALTAWQGLMERAKLQPGERVLIHGGSGAVGVFAVQFARRLGARVLTTASAKNREFLLELGAERVIDYRNERFEEVVAGVDVVFDAVGGEVLKRSWDLLTPGGRLITIAADSEGTSDERTKAAFFIVEPRRETLGEICRLIESGDVRPVVDEVVPFDRAGTAYAGEFPRRQGRGKVVVAVQG
jgi:NADPH:quinone reductase-like Zn-dependent oxidoreductase